MRIAIDIDDICNNLMESVLTVYNNKHQTEYTINDCVNFDLFENFPEEIAKEMYQLFSSPEVEKILNPIEGSRTGIKTLLDHGYKIYFATSTSPENYGWKCRWLLNHYPSIKADQIIGICHKGLLNVDVLIDDNVDNLKSGLYERVCLDRPWNRCIRDDVYDIYRCNSWREIIKSIEEIERKQETWK